MLRPFGYVVEGRMAVDLVLRGVEERVFLVRAARDDRGRRHHPDGYALAAPGVDVTRVAQGHRGVRGVQAPDMLVGQAAPGPDEYLPQRPAALAGVVALFISGGHDARASGLAACLSA